MIDAVNAGSLTLEKLEVDDLRLLVGLDMIAIPRKDRGKHDFRNYRR